MTDFLVIPPRHLRALEFLMQQKKRDALGGIGIGAMREEDEPFALEQIIDPLWDRGLIEDLTDTELGAAGKHFIRITLLGEVCLGMGFMLREPRRMDDTELGLLNGLPPHPKVIETAKRLAQYNASDEQEAIA